MLFVSILCKSSIVIFGFLWIRLDWSIGCVNIGFFLIFGWVYICLFLLGFFVFFGLFWRINYVVVLVKLLWWFLSCIFVFYWRFSSFIVLWVLSSLFLCEILNLFLVIVGSLFLFVNLFWLCMFCNFVVSLVWTFEIFFLRRTGTYTFYFKFFDWFGFFFWMMMVFFVWKCCFCFCLICDIFLLFCWMMMYKLLWRV